MGKIIGHFKTNAEGIVTIVQELNWRNQTVYHAWWQPSFIYSLRLDADPESERSLEILKKWLEGWGKTLTEIKDFGDYELYARYDKDGTLTGVNIKPEFDCIEPIRARDVPIGTFLVNRGVDFFQFWLGNEAVDQYNHLTKQNP